MIIGELAAFLEQHLADGGDFNRPVKLNYPEGEVDIDIVDFYFTTSGKLVIDV